MNSKQIEAQFSAMGARFRTRIVPENRRDQSDYAMDTRTVSSRRSIADWWAKIHRE
jgi:hypothetical protein